MSLQAAAVLAYRAEEARKGKDYNLLNSVADECFKLIDGDPASDACKLRSKLYYELAMGDVQQYEDDPVHPDELLTRAHELADSSGEQARNGGDLPGRLFAHMIIGGHILSKLGHADEAQTRLKRVLKQAVPALKVSSEDDRRRLLRVEMDCYIHLIDLAIKTGGDKSEVGKWLDALQQNAVFGEEYARDHVWGAEVIRRAETYISG